MRKTFTPTYSKIQLMMASSTQPMPENLRKHHLAVMSRGLDAIVSGKQPTAHDWRVVCDGINMMETLVASGVMADEHGTIEIASRAMAGAAFEVAHGRDIRMDAEGIQVVRGILEDYQTALESLTHREMVACHRESERRSFDVRYRRSARPGITVVAV